MSEIVGPELWLVLESSVIVRPSALITPVVSVPESPKGVPTATTGSPTCKVDELINVNEDKSLGIEFTVTTAKSANESEPISFPG